MWSDDWVDLGFGHVAKPTQNKAGEHIGYIIDHPNATDPSKECGGAVFLRGKGGGHPEWDMENTDPLVPTLSPSVRCRTCGDHGFVKEGKWQPA